MLPPLSDQPTEMRPLSEKELDIVYKWRQVRAFPRGPPESRLMLARSHSSYSISFTSEARDFQWRRCGIPSTRVCSVQTGYDWKDVADHSDVPELGMARM